MSGPIADILLPLLLTRRRPAANCLFDHFVGAGEQDRRDFQTERPGGRQIDDQLKLARLHDRQVSGLGALEERPA